MPQPIHDARFSASPLPTLPLRSDCYATSGAAMDAQQDKKKPVSLPTKAPLALVTAGRFDILEHDDRYELVTDAPGFKFGASDISVELKEGVLTISGKHEKTKKTQPPAAAGEERDDKQQWPAGAKVCRVAARACGTAIQRQLQAA